MRIAERRERQEGSGRSCWVEGPPVARPVPDLHCDWCDAKVESAAAVSVGMSWRGGWVYMCEPCYGGVNPWQEGEADARASYDFYEVVCASSDKVTSGMKREAALAHSGEK